MQEFLGYHRPDGRIGVRNHLLILSVGGLTGPTARRIGNALRSACTIVVPYEGGLIGEDKQSYNRTTLGLAASPNVGAVLLVGDNPQSLNEMRVRLTGIGKPHAALSLDECGNDALSLTDRALRIGARLARDLSALRRAPAPISALTIGLKCGRSDPSSGLVANPLIGAVADRIGEAGGSAILGETVEWIGAEHLLLERARSAEVSASIRAAPAARERAAVDAGVDLIGTNPTPTNVAAGLSTIEEKSLGSIAKSGRRPIEGLLSYGSAPLHAGLWVMDAPAYAPESLTGFVSAGAQIVLFSTGVGNSYCSLLAPTIKLSANPATCSELHEQLDFDAHAAFAGEETPGELADALAALVLDIASGTETWGEVLGEGDEVVSRWGQTL